MPLPVRPMPASIAAEMAVHGRIAVGMPEDDLLPVTSIPAAEDDFPVSDGPYGATRRGGVINPVMGPVPA